jgi:hypothetical protein
MLRWAVLVCFVLTLAGCGIGKKGKGNTSNPGESTPTYEWKRPSENLPRPAKSEKTDRF